MERKKETLHSKSMEKKATSQIKVQDIETQLFHNVLSSIESSLTSFCDTLEELCENILGVARTALRILFIGGLIYAGMAWAQAPLETPRTFLTLCCVGMLALSFGEWSLSKGLPLSGIKIPLITLLLLYGLPLEAVTKVLQSF
jgi:hypothetical protein